MHSLHTVTAYNVKSYMIKSPGLRLDLIHPILQNKINLKMGSELAELSSGVAWASFLNKTLRASSARNVSSKSLFSLVYLLPECFSEV